MGLKGKLIRIFGIVIVIMIAVGGIGVWKMRTIVREYTGITDDSAPAIQALLSLKSDMNQFRVAEFALLNADNAAAIQQEGNTLRQMGDDMFAQQKKLESLPNLNGQTELMKTYKAAWSDYMTQDVTIKMLTDQSTPEARAEANAILVGTMAQIIIPAREAIDKMVELHVDHSSRQVQAAKRSYTTGTWFMLGTVLFGSVIGLLLGLWYAVRLSRQIKTITLAATAMSKGDLRVQRLEDRSNDELGVLAKAFNQLSQDLRSLTEGIRENAASLLSMTQEVNSSVEQTSQASQEIAVSIQTVATSADQQQCGVNEMSGITQQIIVGLGKVATNSQTVTRSVSLAQAAAENGHQYLNKASGQMTEISQATQLTSRKIYSLEETSTAVGQIVETISSIAEQTNLLALNAAIEAARAGEQGRGFAVVADEVRNLAEQSKQATREIETLISGIRTTITDTVEAMSLSTQEVESGTQVVNQAGLAFVDILREINAVAEEVGTVATSVEEMAVGSAEIAEGMNSLLTSAKESLNSTQTISASAEEQSAAMEQVTASIFTLHEMAQKLHNSVNRFQL